MRLEGCSCKDGENMIIGGRRTTCGRTPFPSPSSPAKPSQQAVHRCIYRPAPPTEVTMDVCIGKDAGELALMWTIESLADPGHDSSISLGCITSPSLHFIFDYTPASYCTTKDLPSCSVIMFQADWMIVVTVGEGHGSGGSRRWTSGRSWV